MRTAHIEKTKQQSMNVPGAVTPSKLPGKLRDHMINYLLDNRLLHVKQYGFIKGRSTSLQLPVLHIMDKWTEYLEQRGQIDVMYSDFEKVFDKVSHNRLIYKCLVIAVNQRFTQELIAINRRLPAVPPIKYGLGYRSRTLNPNPNPNPKSNNNVCSPKRH